MGTEKKLSILRKIRVVLLILPSIGAATWSVLPALNSIYASLLIKLPNMSKETWDEPGSAEQLRRKMQIHFLDHNIYVPMEDIVINNNTPDIEVKRLHLLMDKSCGRANVYVWLPLKFRIPFMGNKLVEWCWKPTVNIQTKSAKG